jgi:hypothetical protein
MTDVKEEVKVMDDDDLDSWVEEQKAEKARKARSDELIRVAVGLVASGRATIAEAAHLVGCSRQRLHEACRSYAYYTKRRSPPEGARDQLARRWGYLEAKPIPLGDMGAPRREYLDKVWRRLVANYDREQAEIARAEVERQARWAAGDYSD